VVEGRADVLNLLRCGIKNVIAVGGASIPKTIVELSKKKVTTIFIDGDRGGELILKESLQRCDIDYIARAPKGREVEELSKKEVLKYLRLRVPVEQYLQQMNINLQRDDDNNGTSERDLLTYEVFKNGDQESQLRYIKLSVKEMEGTNKVKLISPDFEKVLSLEELSEDLLSGVSFLISDVPITQRVIDRFFNGINSNLTIIGREIYITKKPSNLKILRYEDVV